MRRIVKRTAVIATALAVTTGAGVAYAAWVASGTGTATSKATTAEALSTVDVAADTAAQLFPGGKGDVKIRISNPNDYPVEITRVTGTTAITARTGTGTGTCAVTGVSFADQTNLSLKVPANQAATFTLTGAASMSNLSDDGCQGATFDIPVSFAGASDAS